MKKATHTRFMEICREAGWKCTSQRLAVYDFLQDNLTHPDVDTVWHAVRSHLPAITRESVYRKCRQITPLWRQRNNRLKNR